MLFPRMLRLHGQTRPSPRDAPALPETVCCLGTASVPGAGAGPSAEAFLATGVSPAGAAPGELAAGGSSCGRAGLASQQAGQRAAGGTRGAPAPRAEGRAGSELLTASLEAELGPRPGQAASQPSIPGGFLGCLRPPLLLHPVVTSHLGASRL